jgi:2-iminobutanoate/2-iminopropanoate deaminase
LAYAAARSITCTRCRTKGTDVGPHPQRRHCVCLGFPPFDPDTGDIVQGASTERQTELVLEQMKLCLQAAGSSLANVFKCTVYCTSAGKFAAVNTICARYFPTGPPARVFVRPGLAGDLQRRDCVATV